MAGDLRRASASIAACTELLTPVLGVASLSVSEHLTASVIAELSARTVGQQRDVVIEALLTTARTLLIAARDTAAEALTRLTGLPPAAARSEAGWRSALVTEGHEPGPRVRLTLDRISTLPGTSVVLAVCDLISLTDAIVGIDHDTWGEALHQAWAGERRQGEFDATVEALSPVQPQAADLGWALITFETHKHTNLIWHQANKFERSLPDRSAADLLSWGWMGLRTALRHYNPELGFTFSTYACTRIIGAIRDGVRAENPVPKRLNTFSRKVAATEAELTQRLGRNPTLEEVSATIGVELSSLELLRRTQPQASIEEIVTLLAERGTAPDWMVADDDPADEALAEVRRDAVARALSTLAPEDADAVRLLIMDGLNPTEARAVTGATARQLRQRKERALNALRAQLADWHPDELGDDE